MRKVNKKNVTTLILLVVICAICSVSVFLYINRKQDSTVNQIGTYLDTVDSNGLKENVETKFDQSYKLQDYLVYGQTLSFYQNTYDGKISDPMQGNNISLRNVMSDETTSFTFSGKADTGVDLGSLEEGIYEIYVYDHYQKKRVYFKEAFTADTFTSMRNKGSVNSVVLTADKDILSDYDISFDKNYAFLIVTKETADKDIYDVVIDPIGNSVDYETKYVDYGGSTDLMDEQATSLAYAKKVKKELESYGLKVKILRKQDETLGYYEEDSRIARAYASKAKVYLALGASFDEDVDAPYMLVSPYTNSGLGNRIAYTFENSGLNVYQARSDTTQEEGVLSDSFNLNDNHEYSEFEVYPQLRESGGKATYAGKYMSNNENYSSNYGMYGLYFVFASVNNATSVDNFNTNQKKMTKYLVKGICEYFDIKG